MSLIDSSYFIGEILVPNVQVSTPAHPAQSIALAELNSNIAKYEREYLIKLLGKTLYDEFTAALLVPETWATDLRDALLDATNKESPIAYYVWYWWMYNSSVRITAGGTTEQKSENSTNVSPALKMAESYNKCVRMTLDVVDYMREHYTDLPSAPDTQRTLLKPINVFNI